jgi:hypothetical protein
LKIYNNTNDFDQYKYYYSGKSGKGRSIPLPHPSPTDPLDFSRPQKTKKGKKDKKEKKNMKVTFEKPEKKVRPMPRKRAADIANLPLPALIPTKKSRADRHVDFVDVQAAKSRERQ